MRNKEESKQWKLTLIVLTILLSLSAVGVSAYYYGKSFRDIFVLLMIAAASFGAIVFSLVQSDIYHTLHYDNGAHYIRFVLAFLLGLAACCLLPSLPDSGWAVPAFALALTLFSNTVTGIIAYAGLISICVYFSGTDILAFLLYFLTGSIFAVLFEKLDEDYRTGPPLFIAMVLYSTCMAAKTVYQSYGVMNADIFIMPVINIFITFILMLAVLRFYCAVAIDREKGKYLLINDQEYEMLAKYKTEDKQLYYNAIHTAYFAEKTARLLHMNVNVAKNGGYYHKIIVSECKKQDKTLEEICKENKFPPKAIQLLQEFNYKAQPIKMKETVAVYLADCVVSTITYLLDKNHTTDEPMENVDYGKVAVAVIRRKIDLGILNDSDISLADIGGMEKLYTGEKLYYDFLRGE
ncbi:MAG: hypothetical protein OSJ61_04590 [Lachnospiraceae bacterium]|jgi:hypothetical protein|nr:hypothetical protein [Lachnospiraceae bacterium]